MSHEGLPRRGRDELRPPGRFRAVRARARADDPDRLRLGAAGEPAGFYPGNYLEAWTVGGFGGSLGNSVVVAAIVVGLATVLSIGSGYALGTMRFPGATVLFYLFLLGMMIPAEATIIPLFFDLRTLGLTDTYLAIALPQVAQSIAFGTFWPRAQFRSMPTSLLEAAALDGAGPLRARARSSCPPPGRRS
uniref:carbohydrate ABC transporter permease n=1 Tax=Brachybacterium sp. GPGPB12 TaxID=3023517 RepID=UPI00404AFFF6